MTLVEYANGARKRRGRTDYANARDVEKEARNMPWMHQGNGKAFCVTGVGRYTIENTYDGPVPIRARRNGSLIKNGATRNVDDAKIAVVEDIRRRKGLTEPEEVVTYF